MKNKNEIRQQILITLVSKANHIMDDIAKFTMQIQTTPPGQNLNKDENFLFASHNFQLDTKEIENQRNSLFKV